jgi:PPOX class probable F420-dependent enzyme
MATPDLQRQRNILLTTYRRDGSPVGTPVNVAVKDDHHAYFRTWATSGKVRRIARNPKVTVAPSTARGTETGPTVSATARRLDGDEARAAGEAIDRKYPILQRLIVHGYHRVRHLETVHYELTFADA